MKVKLLAFACFLISHLGFSQTIQPYKNSLFLITSVRTHDTEIFSVNPTTGDAINLTKAPQSEERYPAWSPDGTRIIFTSNREEKTTYNLYIAQADGSNVRRLTNLARGEVAYWASFTADGKWIYFNEGVTAMICRVRPDGTSFERIAEGRDGNISPDGKKIVYTQRGEKGFGVWIMDSDGKNREQIIPNESEIGGIAPVFSADGKKVAFSMQVGEFAEIFSCNTEGSDLKQLTDLKQISSSPAFSPDGQHISFRVTNEAYWRDAQKRDKTYEEKAGDKRPVWVMKTDGSEAYLVEVLHYQCAMDGSRAEWQPVLKKKK
jgi:Tol biopolymer transport system component